MKDGDKTLFPRNKELLEDWELKTFFVFEVLEEKVVKYHGSILAKTWQEVDMQLPYTYGEYMVGDALIMEEGYARELYSHLKLLFEGK